MLTFDFNEAPVRALDRDGQSWFVAADVCRVLEIANSRDAVSVLEDDEKGVANSDTLGAAVGNSDIRIPNRGMQIISESGLYVLIFRSRKPQAKAFRRWVTGEVLPAIRQTGAYTMPSDLESRVSRLESMASFGRRKRMSTSRPVTAILPPPTAFEQLTAKLAVVLPTQTTWEGPASALMPLLGENVRLRACRRPAKSLGQLLSKMAREFPEKCIRLPATTKRFSTRYVVQIR